MTIDTTSANDDRVTSISILSVEISKTQTDEDQQLEFRSRSASEKLSQTLRSNSAQQRKLAALEAQNQRLKNDRRIKKLEQKNALLRASNEAREAHANAAVVKSKFIKSKKMRSYKSQSQSEHQR